MYVCNSHDIVYGIGPCPVCEADRMIDRLTSQLEDLKGENTELKNSVDRLESEIDRVINLAHDE